MLKSMNETLTSMNERKLLRKTELAVRLEMTTRNVNNLMKAGLIPYIKLGTSKQADVRFCYEDVVARLKEKCGVG